MSNPTPAPTRRRSPPPSRRVLRSAALLLIFLLLATGLLSGVGIWTELLAPATTDRRAPAVLVSIPSGANARQIGALLQRHHLVRSAAGFVLAARLEGLSGKMEAGRYELSPAMPPRQIALLIALGKTANDVVTVPEGWTVAQIARRLGELGMADPKTFLTLARTQGRTFDADGFRPPNANLEGYLFPDTYRIPKGTGEREVITQMLRDFHARVLVPDGAALARYPGGLPAAITLASLVEREAETDADRPLIAAALTNRLRIGMPLQCDASVQYALPQHRARLFYADLRVNSPYNTYLHPGLPPTPIANPGLPSIEAALHPARVDYLYYVAGPGGRHIFSRTLAEHNRAVQKRRAAQKQS